MFDSKEASQLISFSISSTYEQPIWPAVWKNFQQR